MATTTNYGWTTPDDTALVKDGALAIRTLGSSIDTTTKALNPSTTLGDIEYRSSTANTNTRLGIGTSGQGLQVVAGVPSWAASSTSTLTTTGDLLYASAANTLARRAIGSTGDILTVSGGLPTWAAPAGGGSLTLLSTTTLSGVSTTISSISGSYTHLYGIVYGVSLGSGFNYNLRIQPNGSSGTTDTVGLDSSAVAQNPNDFAWLSGTTLKDTDTANVFNFTFSNYASTTTRKNYIAYGSYLDSNVSARRSSAYFGAFNSTSALTSLTFSTSQTGNSRSFASGTVLLYGVK